MIGCYTCTPPSATLYGSHLIITNEIVCLQLLQARVCSNITADDQVKASVCRISFDGSSANVSLFNSRNILLFWNVFSWLRFICFLTGACRFWHIEENIICDFVKAELTHWNKWQTIWGWNCGNHKSRANQRTILRSVCLPFACRIRTPAELCVWRRGRCELNLVWVIAGRNQKTICAVFWMMT